MGSTGSGHLSDYSGRKPSSIGQKNGGASGDDICGMAFSCSLEEVGRCFYFMDKGVVPPVGTEVKIVFNGVRIAAETLSGSEIGYLPTRFNYIRLCLQSGFKYGGNISNSMNAPSPTVTIDIVPII